MSSSKRPAKKQQQDRKKKQGKDGIDEIFEKMDLNHDGRISVYELTKAARLLGLNPTAEDAEQMIKDCNPSQKGYVNKTEFRKLFNDRQADIDAQIQEIVKAFQVFDKDNSGTISADEIREVLRKSGEDVDEAEIEEMLKLVDVDGDGNISIEEFACVMCDLN
ncbi:neo-calmodulin-like [Ruditapes philippinarum]|uniref:neo-calmodulin-like n=1 Tax=Ruditapes philippinarum TaxID=129788 RepID=UPI00295B9836|nr:neo-calmodulin-like [Ruditapes philippinarum]